MQGLTPGRIVHFVATQLLRVGHPRKPEFATEGGEHLAAIVTKVYGDKVNLQAFLPECNGTYCAVNVAYSEAKEPGTWHWIERED
jgi:hypothetical protein